MKRRMETKLHWDFKKFDQTLGVQVGIQTNLPISIKSKNQTKPRVEEVSVSSRRGGTEGDIYVMLDQFIGSGYWGIDPTTVALGKLSHSWYEKRISSSGGNGPKHFEFSFELSRSENSFCRAALWRVVSVLDDLGITKLQIPNPEITQRTYVWVPRDQGWMNDRGRLEFGWVDFGIWLGAKYGLGGIQSPGSFNDCKL